MNNNQFVNRTEELRYLGIRDGKADEILLSLIEECEKEISAVARPKFTFSVFEKENCPLPLFGKDINEHITECDRIILFGATIGCGVDGLIRRLQIENISKAVVADTVASSFIEEYCDYACKIIGEKFPLCTLTFRFSPGYGDFPIELQPDFIRLLNADKTLGLCASESFILTPRKSVTAVIGIKPCTDH